MISETERIERARANYQLREILNEKLVNYVDSLTGEIITIDSFPDLKIKVKV